MSKIKFPYFSWKPRDTRNRKNGFTGNFVVVIVFGSPICDRFKSILVIFDEQRAKDQDKAIQGVK